MVGLMIVLFKGNKENGDWWSSCKKKRNDPRKGTFLGLIPKYILIKHIHGNNIPDNSILFGNIILGNKIL